MAAPYIQFDRTKPPMSDIISALQQIRQGRARLTSARAVLIALCDGTTDTAAHFAELTSVNAFQAGGYATADAASLAAFQQIDSLNVILNKPSGSGDAAGAALDQACSFLGVSSV